jgi:hypothetical protein
MIDAFEILRNSDSSGYHNGSKMNLEMGPNEDLTCRKLRKIWYFGAMRRRLAVGTAIAEGRRAESLQ